MTCAWIRAATCRQDGAICSKNKKKLSHTEAYHLELGDALLSHIIGTRGFKGLRSPCPIMAPGHLYKTLQRELNK